MMDTIFGKRIVYRRFKESSGNITGDLQMDSFDDYSIKGEVQIQGENDQLVKFGHLRIGDANAFFRGVYNYDAYENIISPPLKAKNRDEILFNNKWYRIKNVVPEYFTEDNVIFFDCMLVFIKDEEEMLPLDRELTFYLIDHNNNFIVDNNNNKITGKVG